jgi:hypothetical protein
LLLILSPIFILRLSHGGVVFSAGADMQTGRVADAEPELEPDAGVDPGMEPDAEPDAEPDTEPGTELNAGPDVEPDAEPDAIVSMTDVTAVSVGRLLALLIEEWGVWLALVGLP